ncbi:M48 family metalloprotease [Raineyella fluvialis]|uniref:M48 family metalloprotease n=1 Tax=Raineyella fluvialis TaxID=2662261 RepID=A0A5Q2F8R8_9ACTN|nr:M48 family metalloprotease [Raineyella fluvialis]QGF23229.1 M48 family metalloprotease [Raineyella fluvialis]
MDSSQSPSDRPPWPSSTAASFVLLVVLVVLTGEMVGDWLWLGTPGAVASNPTPLIWVLGPPLLLLALTGAVTLLEPRIMVRRRHLEPVSGDLIGAQRFGMLAEAEGVRPCPALMANTADKTISARSVGRPGRYLVVMTPAVLGLARRRPGDFDVLVRHELAHIRSGDVALATFAIRSWHVTLLAMAVPLVVRIWNPDLSLLPSFLLRAGVLALVVYAVRAQLLRVREHYADARATPTLAQRRDFDAALAAGMLGRPLRLEARSPSPNLTRRPTRRRRPPRWLALHPAPAERVAVVAEPGLIGVPRWTSLGAAGYVAGAAHLLLQEALWSAGMDALTASGVARALLFGVVGIVGAGEVVRAASVGRAGARALMGPAVALVVGAALGDLFSIGMTGREALPWGGSLSGLVLQLQMLQTLAAVMSALGVAGLLVWAGDALAFVRLSEEPTRRSRRRVSWIVAVVGATAGALTAVYLWPPLPGAGMVALALLLATVAVMLLPQPRRRVLGWSVAGAGAGLLALVALTVLQRADPSAAGVVGSPMTLVLVVALGVGIAGSLRLGAAAGLVIGVAGTVLDTIAFVLVTATLRVVSVEDVLWTLAWWTCWAVLSGLPILAMVGLVRGPTGSGEQSARRPPDASRISRRRA